MTATAEAVRASLGREHDKARAQRFRYREYLLQLAAKGNAEISPDDVTAAGINLDTFNRDVEMIENLRQYDDQLAAIDAEQSAFDATRPDLIQERDKLDEENKAMRQQIEANEKRIGSITGQLSQADKNFASQRRSVCDDREHAVLQPNIGTDPPLGRMASECFAEWAVRNLLFLRWNSAAS